MLQIIQVDQVHRALALRAQPQRLIPWVHIVDSTMITPIPSSPPSWRTVRLDEQREVSAGQVVSIVARFALQAMELACGEDFNHVVRIKGREIAAASLHAIKRQNNAVDRIRVASDHL